MDTDTVEYWTHLYLNESEEIEGPFDSAGEAAAYGDEHSMGPNTKPHGYRIVATPSDEVLYSVTF